MMRSTSERQATATNWPAYGAAVVAAVYGVVEVAGAEDRAALWWHVLVWDLWFLVWGVLLGLAAWRFGRLTAGLPVWAGGPRGGG